MAKPGGTIYAIGAQGMPWIKIGSTTGPVEKRLRQLQTGHPFSLEVVATVAVDTDAHQIEKQVHAFLTEAQRRGEWFEMPMDLDTLEALIVRAMVSLKAEEARKEQERDEKLASQRRQSPGSAMDHHQLDRGRLRMRRLKLRLSQQQLGEQIGQDQGYVSRLERGEVTDITVRTLARLANALRVSTDYLLGRKEVSRA